MGRVAAHTAVGTALLAAWAVSAPAQTQTYTETTRTEVKPVVATGESEHAKPVAVKPVIVSGTVIRYEPGHAIVIREADKKEVEYALAPNLGVPPGVTIGSNVSVTTEPGSDGVVTVKRIVIDTVTPTGEQRRFPPGSRSERTSP
jgi:hypothetical protein